MVVSATGNLRVEAPTLQSKLTRQDLLEEEGEEENAPWDSHKITSRAPSLGSLLPAPSHNAKSGGPGQGNCSRQCFCLSVFPAQVTIFLPKAEEKSLLHCSNGSGLHYVWEIPPGMKGGRSARDGQQGK